MRHVYKQMSRNCELEEEKRLNYRQREMEIINREEEKQDAIRNADGAIQQALRELPTHIYLGRTIRYIHAVGG